MDESCSIQTLPFSCIKMRNRYQNLLRNKSLIFGGHLIISARPLFYTKNYSQALKSLAVGVKYKYANPYIITQELYFK